MARPKSRPDRVADALQHVLQRIDPERRLELFRVWSAEVGPAIASRAEPTAFRDGILSVRVSNAAWMQELQFAKEDIRQRLNQRLGTEAVRDVYFVAGGAEPRPRPAPVVVQRADDEVEEPIDLPPLRDERLSEVFARIARAHQRRQRS
jgi:predicted nucleic acid-binding Zn ribbon protein